MITLIHGGDLVTAREKGMGTVLDFSANINPLGLPEGVRRALWKDADACERYPDPLCRDLTGALAQSLNVPSEWILCGNGASDLIYRLAFAERPKHALLAAPCFEEYEQALAAASCSITRHLLREEEDFCLTPRILDDLGSDVDLLFLCSPNNPTGQPVDRELLLQIAEQCARSGIRFALDECFLDFLDEPEAFTLRHELERFPNLILFYAFTKMYAIPGLRLGYCLCADRDLLERMYRCGSPWSVSGPAQRAGIQALREEEYRAQTAALIRRERSFLTNSLAALKCRVYGSCANYIFFRPHVPGLRGRLEPLGILVRDCANFHGLDGEYCRVAVRAREENERLLRAMGELSACQ